VSHESAPREEIADEKGPESGRCVTHRPMAVLQLSTYTGLKHSVASGVLTEIESGAFTWPVATGQDSGQSEKRAPGTEQYIDFRHRFFFACLLARVLRSRNIGVPERSSTPWCYFLRYRKAASFMT